MGERTQVGPSTATHQSRQNDLVTGILGVQVDDRAPTVEWSSGQLTVLPFLPIQGRKRRLRNVLKKDAHYTASMATFPEAVPSSSQVVFLDKGMDKQDLFILAREALSCDKVVVVRDYVDTHGFEFTLDGLENHFTVTPHTAIQVHGRHTSLVTFSSFHKLA